MLFVQTDAADKRRAFREALASGRLLQFPGAFSPLTAMLIERKSFDGVYISGAMLSNDLGYPDIGLTTLTEVAERGRAIARATALPAIIDADTGFGGPMNAARTLQELEERGLAGCHFEDQVLPKRCGHLDNKTLVGRDEMVKKIRAAADVRRDDNFTIIARTDARAPEGLDAALDRARAYVDAGADAIFPEALRDEREFEALREAVDVPLLANMTEFGKSKLLSKSTLESLGYNIVIYPVSLLRAAMAAAESLLDTIAEHGSQEPALDSMQHRSELYELLGYADYDRFDESVYNFEIDRRS